MKYFFHQLLAWYLGMLARIVVRREKPLIIAVAGTINKSFTVEAIAAQLKEQGIAVETTPHNFNTDIGLPLAILGLPSGYNSYEAWIRIIPEAIRALKRRLPAVLVLELGINQPGDMKALLRIIEPQIAVITDITQRYRENFGGLDKLASEYGQLLSALPQNGLAVLNYDTILVRGLKACATAVVRFVSLESTEAQVAHAVSTASSEGLSGTAYVNGEAFPFSLKRYGTHHVSSYLIALTISKSFSFKTLP